MIKVFGRTMGATEAFFLGTLFGMTVAWMLVVSESHYNQKNLTGGWHLVAPGVSHSNDHRVFHPPLAE